MRWIRSHVSYMLTNPQERRYFIFHLSMMPIMLVASGIYAIALH